MAKRLYHATDAKNVESILKNGLLRCHGDHTSAFICLSERSDSWLKIGQVLLSVDIDGLDCKITSWIPDGLDEVCVWGDIPPNRIRITKGFQLA